MLKLYHKTKRYIKWLYMLYELNTCLSMCEPWEKVFVNTLFATVISIFAFISYAYMPAFIISLLRFVTPSSAGLEGFARLTGLPRDRQDDYAKL